MINNAGLHRALPSLCKATDVIWRTWSPILVKLCSSNKTGHTRNKAHLQMANRQTPHTTVPSWCVFFCEIEGPWRPFSIIRWWEAGHCSERSTWTFPLYWTCLSESVTVRCKHHLFSNILTILLGLREWHTHTLCSHLGGHIGETLWV